MENSNQEGYSLMNSGVSRGKTRTAAVVRLDLRGQIEAWRELVAECGRKPGRKCVHALRVATLRAQAELEVCAAGLERDGHGARAVRRWRKQANKLRRGLGPLRQADVLLAMLGRLRRQAGGAGNGAGNGAERPPECADEIAELERRIARERRRAARKLAAAIGERQKRLERLSRSVEDAVADAGWGKTGAHSKAIAEEIAGLAGEFAELNAENLHGFRKRVKKIRYRAEVVAGEDTEAARQAAALRRMADGVGEWHDWQTLAQEAAQDGALAGFLEMRTAEMLERALGECRRAMARLAGSAADKEAKTEADSAAGRVPRKPVASERVEAHCGVTVTPRVNMPPRPVRAS